MGTVVGAQGTICPRNLGYTLHVHSNSLNIALSVSCFLGAVAGWAQDSSPVKSRQPVATVSGQSIYDEDLTPSVQAQLIPLRKQEYEIKRRALDGVIEQKVLEAAAQKKALTTEKLFQQEVDQKIQDPTETELQAYYLGQKDRLNRPFEDIRDQLRQALKQARIQQARQDYIKALRSGTEVVVLLQPPRTEVSYDPSRLRGNPKAPVTIVEFSDFQCPYCRQVEPIVNSVLARYGDKINLAYRDFPLRSIHPQADLAAEASRCAGEQGKFWEYHDQLYRTSNLERPALLEYARQLKLDEKQFESCLTTGKYKSQVERDLQEGMRAGVTGTPGFFINGVALNGAQPLDAFARVIDEELARTGSSVLSTK